MEKRSKDGIDPTAGECMTRNRRTISPHEFTATALAVMEEKKITSLVEVDGACKVEGIVHLHDLWGTEMM
jgi:arabinose-5-phosphate isomerase